MSNKNAIKEYTYKDGSKRFMFKYYLGTDPLTGKPLSTTRRGFKTRKQAQDALKQLQFEVHSGTYKKRQSETYRDIYNMWIEHYENTIEESTFVKTTSIFKNHILPVMGDYKIDKIDITTCQKHVNEWSKKLVHFRKVKAYAAKVLNHAIKHGFLDKNPFDLVEMPKIKKQISLDDEEEFANFYNREQLLQFLEAIKQTSPLWFIHYFIYQPIRGCVKERHQL